MKIKSLAAFALAVALLTGCATEGHEHDTDARLQAEAKISKEDATRTALAKVPDGMVKEAELEREHGKLIWSFDIATAGSKNITEVNVDAMTGKVVSVEKETAKQKGKEKEEDSKTGEKEKN